MENQIFYKGQTGSPKMVDNDTADYHHVNPFGETGELQSYGGDCTEKEEDDIVDMEVDQQQYSSNGGGGSDHSSEKFTSCKKEGKG